MKPKKVLFIDRDGTLIREPEGTWQVDSPEKLEFMPGVFRNMFLIQKHLGFECVIATNQDGLGTPAFPEADFRLPHHMMLKAFENEGIHFDAVFIDPHVEGEGLSTRKPATGMLSGYLSGEYDMKGSYVIGDRVTDMELASNLGCRGIFLGPEKDYPLPEEKNLHETVVLKAGHWDEVFAYLSLSERKTEVRRDTRETKIRVALNLDGSGKASISTGIGFFDHLLEQIPRHAGCDLEVEVKGDLQVDEHHTIEDTALALGEAFYKTLADKRGMERYGFVLPMDESRAEVLIDFGGRNWLVWEANFTREKIGDMPTEMFMHFFKSFTDTARCNLHIRVDGQNEHHKIEAAFKAFARAIRMAVRREALSDLFPSTKDFIA